MVSLYGSGVEGNMADALQVELVFAAGLGLGRQTASAGRITVACASLGLTVQLDCIPHPQLAVTYCRRGCWYLQHALRIRYLN